MGKKTVRGHDIANRFVYSLTKYLILIFGAFAVLAWLYIRNAGCLHTSF